MLRRAAAGRAGGARRGLRPASCASVSANVNKNRTLTPCPSSPTLRPAHRAERASGAPERPGQEVDHQRARRGTAPSGNPCASSFPSPGVRARIHVLARAIRCRVKPDEHHRGQQVDEARVVLRGSTKGAMAAANFASPAPTRRPCWRRSRSPAPRRDGVQRQAQVSNRQMPATTIRPTDRKHRDQRQHRDVRDLHPRHVRPRHPDRDRQRRRAGTTARPRRSDRSQHRRSAPLDVGFERAQRPHRFVEMLRVGLDRVFEQGLAHR